MRTTGFTISLAALVFGAATIVAQEDTGYELVFDEGVLDNLTIPLECELCQDGSSITTPDAFATEDMTCAEFAEEASYTAVGHPNCRYYQRFGNSCGCENNTPPPETVCELCQDSAPIPDDDLSLNGIAGASTTSCVELQLDAAWNLDSAFLAEEEQGSCNNYYHLGLLCGCEKNTPPTTGCDLCADGSMPSLLGKPVIPGHTGQKNCEAYALATKYSESSGTDQCSRAQETVGAYCGCTSPPPKACDICPGQVVGEGNIPDLGEELSFYYPEGTTCIEFEYLNAIFETEQCDFGGELTLACCVPVGTATATATATATVSDAESEPSDIPLNADSAETSAAWKPENSIWITEGLALVAAAFFM